MLWIFILLEMVLFIVSPFVRNYMKFKEGENLENNIGSFWLKNYSKNKKRNSAKPLLCRLFLHYSVHIIIVAYL